MNTTRLSVYQLEDRCTPVQLKLKLNLVLPPAAPISPPATTPPPQTGGGTVTGTVPPPTSSPTPG